MNQGPMAEESWHVAADNPDHQSRCQQRRHIHRPAMNRPEQPHMQSRHQPSPLVWPVAAAVDVEDDEGAPGGDCQLMPACKPRVGDCPEKSAKEDAGSANVTAAQDHIHNLVPSRLFFHFGTLFFKSFHSPRLFDFQVINIALITAGSGSPAVCSGILHH